MSEVAWNNILATGYLLVWIMTLVWYQYKSRILDGGTAVMSTYILYAIFSLFSLNDVMFADFYLPLKVFPYIYLYVMLMVALSPTIYIHLNPVKNIEQPQTNILGIISVIIIISSVLLVPDIIANFGTGLVKLFTETDAGKDAYMEHIEEDKEAGSGISNIPAIIYNAFSDITIFLCFYYMTCKKKNYWLIAGLIFAILIGILIPMMHGQRGGVIAAVLTTCVGYALFQQYISRRINRVIRLLGITSIIAIAVPVAAITISRFGNMGGGVTGFLNWYVGQGSLYFNNFALDAGGTRNGDRTLNLAKRLIDPDTPKNYTERREKYSHLNIDDNIFSTFVGDFVIDFGPITTVFIFVIFNGLILYLIRFRNSRDGTLKLHQALLLYFTLCICMQGGMTLFSFSDTGNLRIVILFSLYGYLRYHELLLEKFPVENSSSK
ncbi:MAG: oligosaccharide repeat unit polymerase [Prevotella sp.]|nr:oligosaccharide repeat unit polymerase [Prevotella sp.]